MRDCPAVAEEKVLNVHVLYHGHILDKINISHSCETLQAHKTKLFKSVSGIPVQRLYRHGCLKITKIISLHLKINTAK